MALNTVGACREVCGNESCTVAVCVWSAELADASATDAVDTYVDWHQPVISPRQPPQQALYPPTSSSPARPASVDRHATTAGRRLVVVPASNDRSHGARVASALIVDWLLTARYVHGTRSRCALPLRSSFDLIGADRNVYIN